MEVLVSAALSGDLLFAGMTEVDIVSVYAAALQDLSGASPKAQVARPTAQPEDLIRMLAHAGTAEIRRLIICNCILFCGHEHKPTRVACLRTAARSGGIVHSGQGAAAVAASQPDL